MARRRTGFQKKIEAVHWTFIQDGFAAFAAGTVARNMAAAQHLPETLLRIRGEWVASLDGGLVNGVGVSVVAGLIQVPEGTGATVLWSPLTDGDAPWIWWDTFGLIYKEYVVDAVASTEASSRSRVIDSKAMRKMRNTELQWVVEQATMTGSSASAISCALSARVLSGS